MFRAPVSRSILAVAAVVAGLGTTHAANVSWVGPNLSFWDLAVNWSAGLPGAADDVLLGGFETEFRSGNVAVRSFTGTGLLHVSGATLQATTASSIGGLALAGGSLGSGATLAVAGPSTWTSGTLFGAGSTSFASSLAISGAANKQISGGLTVNAGNTTWSGNTGANNNSIAFANSSTFNNTGTFTDSNALASSMTGVGTFSNAGTYNKQSNTVSTLAVAFNNTGTVNVNAGTLLPSSSGTSSGTFNIANGATLEYRNGSHTLNNITTTGAGTFAVTTDNVGADAVVTLNGGTLTSAFLLGGSTLNGTNQVFQGAATWTGGTLTGAASTTFASSLAITGANGKVISGGRTVNAGNTTWSGNTSAGTNAITFAGASIFNNTGTFTDSNGFASPMSGAGTFNNSGTFIKLSNTDTTLALTFNSTGTVNVNAGTLLPAGAGTSSGTFNIANGATLEYRNGSHTLNNITTSGAGTFAVTSDNVGADAVVTLNGGTHTTAFLFGGSTLTGTDQLFQGRATWTGGALTGAASTTFNNDVTISGPNTKVVSAGRVVNLNATTTWTGNTGASNNSIQFASGGTINNNGTFIDANPFASFLEHNVGGPHNFNNIGTYNKTANTITTVDIGVAFNNTGTVNLNAGIFRPSGGGTSTGVFNIAAGATLNFLDGTSTLNNATTQGAGTFLISTDNVGADAFVNVNGGTHTTPFVLSGSTLSGGDHTFQGIATWSGGAISGAASTTFANNVAITGANTKVVFGGRVVNLNGTTTWSGNTADNNNAIQFWNGGTINNNATFNDANAFASFIEHNVGGPHNFNNNGVYNKTSNTVTTVDLGVVFNNSGTLNVNAGTMRFFSGTQGPTGTINVAAGATYQHDAVSTVGRLVTAGNTALSNRNLTVFGDYDNANFGVGNAFNAHANVTGTGLIVAAGTPGSAQVLTGTGLPTESSLTGGTTAAPTLTIGNVRVGDNALAYQIANGNTGGPAIRGAIQTTVGGANITDARLSGSGVTAANFGPIAPGANAGFVVNFNAPTAGALAPLTGQVVRVANNFDNVAEQNLSIVLGNGAAAYKLAAGQLNTPSLNFGTVQVGQSVSTLLSVTNIATGPAGFVEDLNARFGASSGTGANLISGSGSFANLVAGATNGSALRVNVNTAAAGVVNGAIAVNYFSAGAVNGVSNGLGELGVGASPFGVTGTIQAVGNIINQASPQVNTPTVNLGNVRVGAASPTQAISISNTATTAPQAALNATIAAGAPITATGAFSGLAPGATDSAGLVVGMQTGSAGAKSGTATVTFVSDASNVGSCAPNCQLAIGTRDISVSGNVYRLASPTLDPTTVSVAARVGDAGPHVQLAVGNASPDAFTERLNASFGPVAAGFVGSGAVTGLDAGASSNALGLALNTAAAGTYGGTARVDFVSSGAGTTGAPDASVGSRDVALAGRVYTPAIAQLDTTVVDFGIVHTGDVVGARNVSVTNAAALAAPNDVLVGALTSSGAGPFAASGNLAGVAAQASDHTSLTVTLGTANAGIFNGSANASFASHDAELADRVLAGASVTLKAQVNNFAELALARLAGAGSLSSTGGGYTLDFGTIALGSHGTMAELGIFNVATGPADLLNGTLLLGPGSGFAFTGFGPFSDIAAGASQGGFDIAFDGASLGSFSQTVTISWFGSNAGGYRGPAFDTTLVLHGTVDAIAAVPEPETYLLMAIGIVTVWAARRRSARRQAFGR